MPSGLSMCEAYTNDYPTSYGNVLNLGGEGKGQILVGWSGTAGSQSEPSGLWYRSARDTGNQAFSEWARVYDENNPPPTKDLVYSSTLTVSAKGSPVMVNSLGGQPKIVQIWDSSGELVQGTIKRTSSGFSFTSNQTGTFTYCCIM